MKYNPNPIDTTSDDLCEIRKALNNWDTNDIRTQLLPDIVKSIIIIVNRLEKLNNDMKNAKKQNTSYATISMFATGGSNGSNDRKEGQISLTREQYDELMKNRGCGDIF